MRAEEFIREDAPESLVIKHKPTDTGGAAVEAYIGNREVGFVQFQRLRDGNYKASMAHVSPSMRKQGIGREMYRYARNVLGFNIVPSDSQSDDARAFWSRGGATNENFADGKVKGKSRPGRVKRAGASCAGSVSDLRARAKRYGGEKGKMYHWCANMKSGKRK
jgi:predicted GNAT family acetyltransferase